MQKRIDMHRKAIRLVFSLALMPFGTLAQAPDFTTALGPIQAEEKAMELVDLFGHGEDDFYAVYANVRRMRKLNIVRIGTDSLQALSRTEFALPDIKGMTTHYAFPFSTREKSYLIATADEADSGEVYIFAFEVLPDGIVSQTPLIIGQGRASALRIDDGFRLLKGARGGEFILLIPDEEDPGKNEDMQVRVFDDHFSLLHRGRLRLPYPAGQTSVNEAVVDSSGNIHLLISIFPEGVDDRKDALQEPAELSLVSYDPVTEYVNEKFLAFENKSPVAGRPVVNDMGNVQVAGFYGNIPGQGMDGTYSLEIDPVENRILNYGMFPFGRDFRLRFRREVRQKKSESGAFVLDKIRPYGETGVELTSERRYTETVTVFNPGLGTYTTMVINNFDEIMLTRMTPDGRITDNVLVPKYQSSSRETGKYLSYVHFGDEENTYLFYNDNERNEWKKGTGTSVRTLTGSSSAKPVVIKINSEGDILRYSLLHPGTEAFILYPDFSYTTSRGVILTLYSGSRIRFVKLMPEGR